MTKTVEYLNPIAELNGIDSGEIITPDQAYVIKDSHAFFCPDFDCKDPDRVLIPAISVNKNYFFRHKGNYKHEIRPETLLHKLAIKWFEHKTDYEIPDYKTSSNILTRQILSLDQFKTVCEFRKLKVLIPDVKLCTINGFEFAIEIFVTSDISADKRKLIDKFGLPVIRVDLSKFYSKHPVECRINVDFIKEHLPELLTDINLKSWVIPPNQMSIEGYLHWTAITNAAPPSTSTPTTSDTGCLLGILSLGLIYLFTKDKRKTRFRRQLR